jgi:hypothetical protein
MEAESIRAKGIVPKPEPQEHNIDTLPTSEISPGKGEGSNVKMEAESIRAKGIVPRKPEPQEHNIDTLPTSEISPGKGEGSNVKMEAESGSETDDSDFDEEILRGIIPKAVLVRF